MDVKMFCVVHVNNVVDCMYIIYCDVVTRKD
jgi:hypothetical protein